MLDRTRFTDRTVAELAVFDFIEGFYNTRRRHSGIGYIAPAIFEQRHAARFETNASEGSHPSSVLPLKGEEEKDLIASL